MLAKRLAVLLELNFALNFLAILAGHIDLACFLVFDLYEMYL